MYTIIKIINKRTQKLGRGPLQQSLVTFDQPLWDGLRSTLEMPMFE